MKNIIHYFGLVIFTLGICCGMAIASSKLGLTIAIGIMTVPVIVAEMRLLEIEETKRGVKGVRVVMGEQLDGD